MTTGLLFLCVVTLMGLSNAAMVVALKSSRRKIARLKASQLQLRGQLENLKGNLR